MRRWKDPFPTTPRSFHLRVNETLLGLEENDMKDKRYSRFYRYNARVVAVAVIAAILLTATAVAAVIGGNALKEKLAAYGAQDFAAQVQDIHTQDAAEGFSLSVDEAVWEGEKLFVSYTVTVPDEGGPWLVGLYTPRLNGEKLDYDEGAYFDTVDSPWATVMGGGFTTQTTRIQSMILEKDWKNADVQNLEIKAVFMKPKSALSELPDDYDDLVRIIETIDGREVYVFNDSKSLMYENRTHDEGIADVRLDMVPEVQMMFEEDIKKTISEAGFDPERSKNVFSFSPEGFWATEDCWDKVEKALTLNAERFESTGIADTVCERSVSTLLDVDSVQETVYNAVSEPFHEMNGYSIEIEKFKLSHLQYRIELVFRKDGGLTDREVERFKQGRCHDIENLYEYTLMTTDGNKLVAWDEAYIYHLNTELNGQQVIRIIVEGEDIIDLEKTDQLMLVPYAGDGGYVPYLMDEAITITPIIAETVVDPNAVWCTLNGTYYHCEQYCMGMRGAQKTTVEEAEAMGKKPCPECG